MSKLIIHEVGMRDGLQMEKQVVPQETKIKWIESLIEANVDIIQLGSFVNPSKMPQMADTDDLFKIIRERYPEGRRPILSGLVLNERGLERAVAVGVEMICMGISASETHSQKNTGMSSHEAQDRIIKMAVDAKQAGNQVQVSVQSAFGCGFEGKIDEGRVLSIIDKYLENGLTKISLADTAGHAYPQQVEHLFGEIKSRCPEAELTCHFHNTYGLGMANVFASINSGVDSFEVAFGGLGGCPFTKTAAGNVSTEDMLHYFYRMGKRKDVSLEKLIALAKEVSAFFDRTLPGYIYKTGTLNY